MHNTIRSWQRAAVPQAAIVQAPLAGAAVGAWSCDLASEALAWTQGVFDIFGLDPRDAIDRRETLGLYDEPSREMLELKRRAAICNCEPFILEARICRPDGTPRWMRITAAPGMVDGRLVSLHGMKQDITAEREAWDALRKLAWRDPLTGLSNRACFQADFLGLAPGSDGLGRIGALALFDLDRFKSVNDRWGHLAGDACLEAFARRLLVEFPDALMLARIGGDEFALLLARGGSPVRLERQVRRAVARIESPVAWRGELLPFSVSAGVALAPFPGATDAGELFARADAALYRDKAARAAATWPGRSGRAL